MRRVFIAAAVAVMSYTACVDDPRPTTSSPGPSRSAGPTADATPTAANFDPSSVRIELEPFVTGLTAPLLLTHAGDGSGRSFVVEQGGRIRTIADGKLAPDPLLDITDKTEGGGEQGLLGLAFHPDFERDGRFFVNYTDLAGDTVIASYRVDGTNADPASEQVLLKIEQPYSNHNGGHLEFGPDGYLYIATGDGGSAGDPQDNAQNRDSLLGKLLRLDVDGDRGYEVPPDNPFADGSQGAPEVWAYGLRNPWRFSFDEPTQTLWVADVGQGELEEVNRVGDDEGGLDFGWNQMEGSRCYQGRACETAGRVLPITEYEHDLGCSITGGFVYRGSRYSALRGGYFFADYCSGRIWAIEAEARGPVEPTLLLSSERALSSFGLDEEGELYVTDIGAGEVLRVVSTS